MQRIKINKINYFLILSLLVFSICLSYPAQASKIHEEGGIMPSHSAEYVRTLNRNASMDVDAAFYNPAGLVFLKKDGLYAMFSSQTMIVNRTMDNRIDQMKVHIQGSFNPNMTFDDYLGPNASPLTGPDYVGRQYNEYELNVFSPAQPDLNIVYKKDDFAGYFNFAILQAMPLQGAKFKDGVPQLDNGMITLYNGYSMSYDLVKTVFAPNDGANSLVNFTRDSTFTRHEQYISATLGGAFKIIEYLSASLGVRFISATVSTEMVAENVVFTPKDQQWDELKLFSTQLDPWRGGTRSLHIETESKGHGLGFIGGTHLRPIDDLSIGMRFEYYTPLVLKNNNKKFEAPYELRSSGEFDLLRDDVETKVTFPPSASIGISYNINDELRIEAGFDYYFRKYVDYGKEVPDDTDLFYVTDKNAKHRMRKDQWNNGYRAGCAVEVIWDELKISAGYSYSDPGLKPENLNVGRALIKSHTIGAGGSYEMMADLVLTLGAFYMLGIEQESERVESNTAIAAFNGGTTSSSYRVRQKFNETRYGLGFGATYRLDI